MQEDLKAKLAADILKSGFGAEMRVLKVLRSAGWSATGLASYEDRDTLATREFDVKAHYVLADGSDDETEIYYQSFYSLVVEVKKSEKPWIVFKEDPLWGLMLQEGYGSKSRLNTAFRSLVFCDGVKGKFRPGIQHTVGETGLAAKMGWIGNGVHEAFKNPDQPSRSYSAFVSICKAAESDLEGNSWDLAEGDTPNHHPYLWYVKPVIVLDGKLFSSELDDENELSIVEEEMCSVRFEFTTSNYGRGTYIVDVVQIEALTKYIKFCEERCKLLTDALNKLAKY